MPQVSTFVAWILSALTKWRPFNPGMYLSRICTRVAGFHHQVLLAANVAFLAIQSVDGDKDDPYRSPSQIASYLSTLTSVSSMISGLLLVRHTRTKGNDTAWAATDYLRARQYPIVGHEALAVIYSLPYAFFMWAVIYFMIAFLLACLLETTRITRLLTGTVGLICFVFIVWRVWMNWDHGPRAVHESRWNNSSMLRVGGGLV